MRLISACTDILEQLGDLISNLDNAAYCKPATTLSNSTVGQHIRHTLEFFLCLQQGFESGVINYDNRKHDHVIETDRAVALSAIDSILDFIHSMQLETPLMLEVDYNLETDATERLETTAKRELVYNIEHAVHHMAIIKIGIREVAPAITLRQDFGVAASTIRYKGANKVLKQTS